MFQKVSVDVASTYPLIFPLKLKLKPKHKPKPKATLIDGFFEPNLRALILYFSGC